MDQPTASTEQSNPALRPLTLPAPPAWSQLTSNKQRLAALKADLESSNKLATKLESFTDEPTWNAYIPFGPLAYFSGQLIHTNDITHTLPVSPIDSASNSTPSLPPAVPSTAEEAAQVAEAGADWRQGDAWKVLKSAKQARTSALKSTEGQFALYFFAWAPR
ncbi:hypothetical protein BCR35DRAFT_81106 [Leucosporidium creatinivorum]|uniref:Uncharacterized protein n=1 Tax=Leucosporidium creatinivorum TaxID=106004 RepID=A0A1Y2FFC9_9BASI|nr:hypothetical protein BCR35DRAFT_81106 [Leucosporidium creatinivorum]